MRLPWTTKRDLRDDIAALEAQIERMEKVNTAVSLMRAGAQPDKSFLLELHSEAWPLLAQSLYCWFMEQGGTNYVEQVVGFGPESDKQKASLTFKAMDGIRAEMFTLTLQRLRGKTPHALRAEAEREVARLQKRIELLERHDEADPATTGSPSIPANTKPLEG